MVNSVFSRTSGDAKIAKRTAGESRLFSRACSPSRIKITVNAVTAVSLERAGCDLNLDEFRRFP
jgi:hypothetical protein